MHQYCLEANQLDGIFAEKILFVFLDKMYMSQQCAFVEKMYFGLHWEENCQQVKWGGTSVRYILVPVLSFSEHGKHRHARTSNLNIHLIQI